MDRLAPERPARLGLAVSGGSDSIALMHLARHWAGAELHIATVDHGLRPEAPKEAAFVAQSADAFGLSHVTLRWQGWSGQGNLQDAARQARRSLLAEWAQHEGLQAVFLGHTQNDQAETFLMRLARGSGVDGLAAMAPVHVESDIRWLRPLLQFTRDELRDWLRVHNHSWVEDPSNDNTNFDRIKARQALQHLEPLGLSAERLVQTAQRMAEARAVLDGAATDAARHICRFEHGDFVFDAAGLDALAQDTRHRLVARALCDIASKPYRPRLSALRAALCSASATVHGCLLTRTAKELRITREQNAVKGLSAPLDGLWDRRWHVQPPAQTDLPRGLIISALGETGLAQCPDRSAWRLPRRSLLSSPAVWLGSRLIAAPLAGFAPDWGFCVREPDESFFQTPYSH
jgi:tRNA(Ile)-lysidine synthase